MPVDEVIGTLQAEQRLVAEFGQLIETLVDGVSVERVELRLRSLNSGSLKEAFLVALFLTYQSHLEEEIPAMLEAWAGIPADDRYDTVVTIGILLLLFYGVDYAYRRLVDQLGTDNIREKLADLSCELAHLSGRCEVEVRQLIERHLGKKDRLRQLGKAAIRFFRPSRNQKNEEILVGDYRIGSEIIREVPNQVDLSDLDRDDHSVPIYGTRVEIRAKDHDHDGSGWGAIVAAVSSKRRPLRLYPNVSKDYLWNNDSVWADVMVTYRSKPNGPEPIRYHIMNVLDGPPKRDTASPSEDPTGD